MNSRGIFKLSVLIGAAAAFACCASARIGEDKGELETRMLSKSGGAFRYTSKEDYLREAQELPYKRIFLMMPRDASNSFYFKRADLSTTTGSDVASQNDLYGWELHICFLSDKSALEFYRRYGEPMTVEELMSLMYLESKSKESAHWVKNTFMPLVQRWEVKIDNGSPVAFPVDDSGKAVSASAKTAEALKALLPKNRKRFVYVEIPPEVTGSSKYKTSLHFQLMEIEQRAAYEAYRTHIAKQAAFSASKTAPTSTSKKNSSSSKNSSDSSSSASASVKIIPFNGTTERQLDVTIPDKNAQAFSIFRYRMNNVFFGGEPIVKYDKQVRMSLEIPEQPDTAFGYDFELSDGSLRAKLYNDGVLFISSEFDKSMRKFMEELYSKQSAARADDAASSVSRF